MRRFITSLTGKLISHLVIVSLVASFFTTAVVSRAAAQVTTLPLWAVTEFTTHNGLAQTYGQVAATAVNSELSSGARYQMISPTQVTQKVTTLGLTSPLQGTTNLLRVGQELRASTIVTGDVIAAQVNNVGGGRQARVAIRAIAYDVASGLPINGSAVAGQSTIRNGSVTDDELIRDAIRAGANLVVRDFNQHQLPSATVLNTLTDRCYFNAGTRAGFTSGQQVVITRGREEVATGHVSELQPDEAVIVIERSYLGVAPGDHVRAIFPVPDVAFDAPFARADSSSLKMNRTSHGGNNSGLISLLVVVGLVGVLLGNGGNTNTVLNSVTAEAALFPPPQGTIPSVRVSWSPNAYAKGNSQLFAWQVYRSDYTNAPVAVASGTDRQVYDQLYTGGFVTQYTFWTYLNGLIGGSSCTYTSGNNMAAPVTIPSLVPGTPYIYQVELIYQLSSIDLPIITTSGGTSTGTGTTSTGTGTTSTGTGTTSTGTGTTSTGTGTTSTGTGTTSTGTGTTSTGTGTTSTGTGSTSTGTGSTSTSGASVCYFASQKQSSGTATPLPQPVITAPTAGLSISPNDTTGTRFTWLGSSRNLPLQIQYVLQFSLSPAFPNNASQTYDYPTLINSFGSGGSSGSSVTTNTPLQVFGTNSFLPSAFRSAATVYFRVGARATEDSPGPVPDPQTHQRFIFSNVSYFTQQGTVPVNPGVRVKSTRAHH